MMNENPFAAKWCAFCGAAKCHLEWVPLFAHHYCPPCLDRKIALMTLTMIQPSFGANHHGDTNG